MKKYISKYVTFKEYQCSCCHHLPPDFYSDNGGRSDKIPMIYSYLFENFEEIRRRWGKAIPITSGYRCPEHQQRLIDNGVGALASAHVLGLALDLDTKSVKETEKLYKLIADTNPDLRIGMYTKAGTFVHIDIAYMANPRLSRKWYKGNRWFK